jgi:hypothetical protein
MSAVEWMCRRPRHHAMIGVGWQAGVMIGFGIGWNTLYMICRVPVRPHRLCTFCA